MADKIFLCSNIISMDGDEKSKPSAIAVKEGVIKDVGGKDKILLLKGNHTQVLFGLFCLLPFLQISVSSHEHDYHCHIQ